MISKYTIYDTLIIGSGPGGLSTALGLGRQSRSCLVITHQRFRNDGIEASHAVLGHDHVHPQKIWARGREQIERYQNTSYAQAEIISAKREALPQWQGKQGFSITSRDGQVFYGKTLVLAMGVKDQLPDLDGYKENWPRNIYQCLFCDGWERRHGDKAILCTSSPGAIDFGMAAMALGQDRARDANGSSKVTLLANAPLAEKTLDEAAAKKLKGLKAQGVHIDQRRVLKLENAEPEREGVYAYFQDAKNGDVEKQFFSYIVHKPRTELNALPLIRGLGLETTSGPFGDYVKVTSPMQSTDAPGVFVAGDAGALMTHVTTAMANGVAAAGGVVHYLLDIEMEDALAESGVHKPLVEGSEDLQAGCRH